MTSTRESAGTPGTSVPPAPAGRIELRPLPPSMPAEGVGGLLMNALPLLGSLGSVGLVVTMGGGSGGRAYLAAGLFLATTLGFVVVQVDRQRTLRGQRVGDARAGYLHHLAGVRADVRDAAERQRRALGRRHPEPAALPALAAALVVERSRLWARAVDDDAFLQVRYAVGEQPLGLELRPAADDDPERADPVAVTAQQRLLAVHRTQADLPLVLDLRGVHRLELCGPPAAVRCLARAVVCSAVMGHSPGQLAVAVLCTGPARAEWEWVKWLPHARSDRAHDALGRRRMVATSPEELAALLPADLRPSPSGASGLPPAPHLLLVVDGRPPTGHRPWLAPGARRRDRARAGGPGRRAARSGRRPAPAGRGAGRGRPPSAPRAASRRAAGAGTGRPLRRGDRRGHGAPAGSAGRHRPPPGPAYDGGPGRGGGVERRGAARAGRRARPRPRHRLAAPTAPRPAAGADRRRPGGGRCTSTSRSRPSRAMGPHGLVVGATGSGKSELLRTLVLALATSHSPEELNLVLVDFKGGATFAGMAGLPHVSALITNLEEELTLVDRMEDALAGELVRRQALLRRAGNLASSASTDARGGPARRSRRCPRWSWSSTSSASCWPPGRSSCDLFETIGRLGRSLGVHLVLASQRLEEGRLRGLEAHLSYRIGLRTFSAGESRSALGVPDAHALPAVPGVGCCAPVARRWSGSRPPTCRARRRSPAPDGDRRRRGSSCRSRPPGPRSRRLPSPARTRRRPVAARRRGRPPGRPRAPRAPGLAAAAGRPRHPRRPDGRPRRRPPARARLPPLARPPRTGGAARGGRPAARPAPRPAGRRPGRGAAATWRWSAGPAAARARCCARSSRASR